MKLTSTASCKHGVGAISFLSAFQASTHGRFFSSLLHLAVNAPWDSNPDYLRLHPKPANVGKVGCHN